MKRKLIFPGLHTSCVASCMGRGNVSLSVQYKDVVNHILKINVSFYIQNSVLQVGEPQIKRGREKIRKEETEIEGIKEVRQEALREEEIDVVNLQRVKRGINHPSHQEKE